ncbi:MAG TPA: hypothetical protein VHG33_12795 [Woeseiaceae bacterium]|nr:hypothetical protein [Woeseiaceae bacterium]
MDTLAQYPYVVVRISCELCARRGRYRLARLAAKYGPETPLDMLLAQLTADCAARDARHPYRSGCKARFSDLDQPRRPPDNPALTLRVVRSGKSAA